MEVQKVGLDLIKEIIEDLKIDVTQQKGLTIGHLEQQLQELNQQGGRKLSFCAPADVLVDYEYTNKGGKKKKKKGDSQKSAAKKKAPTPAKKKKKSNQLQKASTSTAASSNRGNGVYENTRSRSKKPLKK